MILSGYLSWSLTIAVFITLCAAQPELTNSQFNPVVGQTFTITWANAVGTVTIFLMNGPASNLAVVGTICSGISGTSCTWNVPTDLPTDTYYLEIQDSSAIPNYSAPFTLTAAAVPQPTLTSPAPAPRSSTQAPAPPAPTTTSAAPAPLPTTSTSTTSSSSSPSSPATSAASVTDTTSASATSPTTGSPAPSSDAGSGGLSTGAKAGIGAGAAVAGLVVLSALAILIYRRGKAAGAKTDRRNGADASDVAELGTEKARPGPAELAAGHGHPAAAAELGTEPMRAAVYEKE